MAKAVFLDYTGTILQTSGPDIEEMMERFTKGASFASQQEAVRWWFSELGVMEEHAYQENFVPEEELCMRILEKAVREKGLKEDLLQMQRLNVSFWMYAPLYSDVRYFFEQCTNPIYIITNNSEEYVKICLRRNGLHANAVISADSVRAYKPRRELFEKALATAAVEGHDGIMIGDSTRDMEGASSVGMNCILLDRHKDKGDSGYRTVHSLREALRLL
ncbi:MAG: HAD family hydrolase [Galactobacillus timonensis]|uniref:HAD family hydrolase n=1 Tax=Galactobacillus timonensis TaxID=2041840 RepID=UPI000EE5363F|nr:HAD family hydrolase [Galactobacillus timonensis]MDY5223365.1 HAD family hydrolase [Lachnospiraceae bacterium]HCV54706.1 HAD family hydrolase [Erysipelotrichaceae bacterium]MCI6066751.1 HAD family hydrolase [Galactobacillus timonensis]MCI6753390.1 HAD family hydrolase [Galactobacillus timonensis]MDD7086332.1 HAD family hydrolase [Galactobacillus timonensis]